MSIGIIKFENEISDETVRKLMYEISEKLSSNESILLYFTCNGGPISDATILVDYINRFYERIELVCAWTVASSGFDIMLKFKGTVILINPVYGVCHLGSNKIDIVASNRNGTWADFNKRRLLKSNKKYLTFLKPYLTPTELTNVSKGEDVYLDHKRLSEILKIRSIEKKRLNDPTE